jgi:hypothetical protein
LWAFGRRELTKHPSSFNPISTYLKDEMLFSILNEYSGRNITNYPIEALRESFSGNSTTWNNLDMPAPEYR